MKQGNRSEDEFSKILSELTDRAMPTLESFGHNIVSYSVYSNLTFHCDKCNYRFAVNCEDAQPTPVRNLLHITVRKEDERIGIPATKS